MESADEFDIAVNAVVNAYGDDGLDAAVEPQHGVTGRALDGLRARFTELRNNLTGISQS
ncbi:hypothetical protein GCM10022255_000210 [Dactylosporangium darangshiense]|uniref:Uncharacterized protein n=1 Tax=Dactylosporangium darangshiense TaxID=579108 RepID=A0ABP8CSU8_9ACTN